jgi:putative salt-induced outer membrane protein YdiY
MLALLFVGALFFQPVVPLDEPDIVALEQQLFRAIEEKNPAVLDSLLSDDFILRGSPDMARDVWLTNAVTLCWGPSWDVQQLTVRADGDTQVASFILNFYRDPLTCRPAALRSLITDVWVRRDTGWKLWLRHSGPVGEAGPRAQYSPVPPQPPPFEGRGELSFVSTGGNASTQTLGFSTELIRRYARTTTNGRASFLRSATDDIENARVLTALVRHSVRLSDRVEAFARGGYLRDNFAGIQHRTNFDAGLSYVVRQPLPRALKFDFGLGGTRENRLADVDQAVLNATLGVSFRARLAPTAEVTADSQAIADLGRVANYRLLSDLSLTASLNSMWSARIAYATRYANQPVPGFQRADHTLSASLAIRYVRPAPGGRR